ncbi:tripartite tricarboxylate transporter substrate binding protein [Hydrogenophaga sp. BPS33]|uniref:tripartite tricarboxylate transporter substrate binding protein n=1 Tax=Hydrogenophaga sp. BPS33 TaxID=2651974 RepID=UPI00135A40EC|nr:tripartite tricarboxylate transporter substrate binding protein [Hydrogenophaga sp. BPS33]
MHTFAQRMFHGALSALVALGLLTATAASAADPYPTGPIKLVLGVTPGGGTDVIARALAQKLTVSLGQSVIVDNRPGAGQTIGAAFVARAPADGHTLLFGTQTFAANPSIYPNLPFDSEKDFVPVAFITRLPYAIFINGQLPAKNLQEFIALAKSKPGDMNFASAGASSLPRIAGELFKLRTGTDLVHVPFNGTAPAVMSVVAGQTQMWIGNFLTMEPHLVSGKLRALAVASEQRYPNAPTVPTVAEAGLPGLHLAAWYGVMARTGTPPAIVERLNREFNKALADPEIKQLLVRDGAEPGGGQTPQQFGEFLKAQMKEFQDVARKANIVP